VPVYRPRHLACAGDAAFIAAGSYFARLASKPRLSQDLNHRRDLGRDLPDELEKIAHVVGLS
jgi:hypothetical protein